MNHTGADLPLDERERLHMKLYREELLNPAKVAGLMEGKDRKFYVSISFVFTGLILTIALCVFFVSDVWSAIIAGLLLGIDYGQIGVHAHQVGHRQVLKNHRSTRVFFEHLLGNVLLGLVGLWWKWKHNELHHTYANVRGKDRDINIPLPLSAAQARERGLNADSFRVKFASWIFPLLLPWQAIGARLSSVGFVKDAYRNQKRWLSTKPSDRATLPKEPRVTKREMATQYATVSFYALMCGALIVCVGYNAGILAGILLFFSSQFTHGIYNCAIFATNHKLRPQVDEGESTWLERQILLSHDVHGGRLVLWVSGGLNYQIAHHVWPEMPMEHLKVATENLLIPFCQRHGFERSAAGVVKSYVGVMQNFPAVTRELRENPMG